ncbi:MAG: hypothetical protein KVP17_002011 [Porospora cf. gigantea B]|uniref:uncharacterized protein n=2 Tax=Porospora cf. gigantea B TaxID=2853592 RepID=UPI003571CA90|nr:MAG: hypothetical protein KVP17_002011 [Porospora cf. gigantea B]
MTSSGIAPVEELLKAYTEFKMKGKADYLVVKIEDEKLKLMSKGNGTIADVAKLKEIKSQEHAYFVVYRMKPPKSSGNSKLVLIRWVPESCSTRDKMLIASSQNKVLTDLEGLQQKTYGATALSELTEARLVEEFYS